MAQAQQRNSVLLEAEHNLEALTSAVVASEAVASPMEWRAEQAL